MAGLREHQKEMRKTAIVHAASALFKQIGYEASRIDAIAVASGLSVGTLYNYFETKADLLLAIVSMEVEEVLSSGETIVAEASGSAYHVLCELVENYYDHSLYYLTKEMWRSAVALSIQRPDTPFSKRYRALDAALNDQVVELIKRLQADDKIAAQIDAATLGEVIFIDLNALFVDFTINEDMTMIELREAFRRHLRELLGPR